jgi:HAD superfamily hydrolase (TIGR01549 family)
LTTDIIGIYFDFFGTLIDSGYAITKVWSRITKKLGKEIEYDDPRIWEGIQKQREESDKLKKRLNINYMNYSQEDWDYLNSFVLGIIGIDNEGTSEIISEEFDKFFFEYYRLYPGCRETLEQIKAKNIKIGLHTHAPREPCQVKLKELKIFEFFDIFIHTQDYGYNKSQIEIYQIALDAMKTRNPGKIFHVGDDLELDVKMAQKIGMIPVLFDPYKDYSLRDIIVINEMPEMLKYL